MMTMTNHVTLSPAACQKVAALTLETAHEDTLKLRVFIEGGGCSGFQYGFTFETEANTDDAQYTFSVPLCEQEASEQSPFSREQLALSDNASLPEALTLLVDPISHAYLIGATIDYVINETGQSFVVDNPHAKTTCGCGSSFST